MKSFISDKLSPPNGAYSHAIISGNFVFTAGQTGNLPDTGKLIGPSITEQTEQVCKNIKSILESCGTSMDKVVKTTCFLTDMNDIAAYNEVFSKYFTSKPARSTIGVKELPRNAIVEIEAVAEL